MKTTDMKSPDEKKLCPACGEGTHIYGGSWACNYWNCTHSQFQAYAPVKEDPWWWNEDIVIKRDGDEWCAHREGFTNLQESLAGFGWTPHVACENLRKFELSHSA